jgi:hypothetical protein
MQTRREAESRLRNATPVLVEALQGCTVHVNEPQYGPRHRNHDSSKHGHSHDAVVDFNSWFWRKGYNVSKIGDNEPFPLIVLPND